MVETYHAEFVIESNVTMDISTVLGSLNPSQISQPGSFSVTKLNLTAGDVTFFYFILTIVCLV